MKRTEGFTLIEVMVACFLLLIAFEILSVGMSYCLRVKSGDHMLLQKGSEAEERFWDKNECIPGTVSLLCRDEVIWEETGWLYGCDTNGDGEMELACILVDDACLDCRQEELP